MLSPPCRGMVAESPICRYPSHLNERTVKPEARLYRASRVPGRHISYNLTSSGKACVCSAAEEVMKAVLALVIIYVGAFFLAIQGAPQNPTSAAPQSAAADDQTSPAAAKPIVPLKDADIHSLME